MDYDRINRNIKFRIDRKKYFRNYMEIRKACMLSGFAPPQYLDILNLEIPDEHYNVEDERELEFLLTDDFREKLMETYENRRREDVRIMHMPSEFERENMLTEIYNKELEDFFDRFPQFKIILEEE